MYLSSGNTFPGFNSLSKAEFQRALFALLSRRSSPPRAEPCGHVGPKGRTARTQMTSATTGRLVMHFKVWMKMALPIGSSGFVLLCIVLFLGVVMTSFVVIGRMDRSRSELRRGQLHRTGANLMTVDFKLSECKVVCAPRRQESARRTAPRIFDVSTRWGEQLRAPVTLSPGKGRCSHCTGG